MSTHVHEVVDKQHTTSQRRACSPRRYGLMSLVPWCGQMEVRSFLQNELRTECDEGGNSQPRATRSTSSCAPEVFRSSGERCENQAISFDQ